MSECQYRDNDIEFFALLAIVLISSDFSRRFFLFPQTRVRSLFLLRPTTFFNQLLLSHLVVRHTWKTVLHSIESLQNHTQTSFRVLISLIKSIQLQPRWRVQSVHARIPSRLLLVRSPRHHLPCPLHGYQRSLLLLIVMFAIQISGKCPLM